MPGCEQQARMETAFTSQSHPRSLCRYQIHKPYASAQEAHSNITSIADTNTKPKPFIGEIFTPAAEIFSPNEATMQEVVSVRPSVRPSVYDLAFIFKSKGFMPAAQLHDSRFPRKLWQGSRDRGRDAANPVFPFIFTRFIIHGALMSSELIEGLRDQCSFLKQSHSSNFL